MTQDRWDSFSTREQLLMIGSEILRAKRWQEESRENFHGALERAFLLIDLTLNDKRWRSRLPMLLWLRQELAKYYLGQASDDIGILYTAL